MNENTIKIMIADDHKIIRDGLHSLLQDEPHIKVVAEVENGKEALKQLGMTEIDVLLTDITMPEVGGIELTKKVKEFHPKVNVLVLTMHEDSSYIKQLIDAGAAGYILKNTGRSEMIQAIEKVAEGKKYLSNEVYTTLLVGDKKPKITDESGEVELTKREIEVLRMIAEEMKNHEIAEKLFVSPRTVDTHRRNLLQKLNVKNTAGLVKYAVKHGLVD